MCVLIDQCQQEMNLASSQQIKEMYSEIQERCQIAFKILMEPDCEMNEDLFYGILHLISANQKIREEIYGLDGRTV